MRNGLSYRLIILVFLVSFIFIPSSLGDSTTAATMRIGYRVGTDLWKTLCTCTNCNSIACSVGSESSPRGSICDDREGYVDIYLYKDCETTGGESSYRNDIYYISWDGDRDDCECIGETWFSNLGTSTGGSYDFCCGDDGGTDDWATYSGSTSTSTTISCRRCYNGGDQGTLTLRGNGYLTGSGTSRTCYYGNIACTGSSASHGSSQTVYGWGWYSGNLQSDTSVSCRSGAAPCTDGSAAHDSISTLYGNGYILGGICYYGDITCSSGSESHGASCSLGASDICGNAVACQDCAPYHRSSTTTCYTNCATNDNSKCAVGYHCNAGNTCVSNLADGQTCTENSDCQSSNCALKRDGGRVCVGAGFECADNSNNGVNTGFQECFSNTVYECTGENTWTPSTNGDPSQFACQCVLSGYQGLCANTYTSCWDNSQNECCGDDDNSATDYFWTQDVGGCVGKSTSIYDTIALTITDITSDTDDIYYFNKTSSTSGLVYFNSVIASGTPITFTVDWNDANSDYGRDDVSALKSASLLGGVGSSTDISPPGTISYTFNAGDNSGVLYIYARDAVSLNDTMSITFQEDTTLPSGSIIINGGDTYTDNVRVNLSLTSSDNIGVRDCAYSNNNNEWTSWTNCTTSKSWAMIDEDGRRDVFLRIRDLAGNILVVNDSIILDRSGPRLLINNDDEFTNVSLVNLNMNFELVLGDPVECSFMNESLSWTPWEECNNTADLLHSDKSWYLEDSDGERTVSLRVNTSFGSVKQVNDTIIYDSTPPTGSIEVWAINVPGIQNSNTESTAYTTVDLILEYYDVNLEGCRFANEAAINFTPFEPCETIKTWVLDEDDGLHTVYYQINDSAGNIVTYSDTIFLNKTGAGVDVTPPSAAVVMDDGDWTNDNESLHAVWYGAEDPESVILNIPLIYEYSIGTTVNGTEVVGWTSVGTDTEMTHNGLSLTENQNYYINVRTINSAGLTNDSSGNGIIVDITPPTFDSAISSSTHDLGAWTNRSQNNDPAFSWSASDPISGIYGFSYILDQAPSTTPDKVPEGDFYNLAAETDVQYSNILDGILYFHVRSRDNAGNWGSPEHFEVRIDASPPSTPQITTPSVVTDLNNLSFNWTASYEPHSSFEYHFELYNNSNYNSSYLVNYSYRAGLNITVFNLVSNVTYYPRVRAENDAGLASLWSSEVSTEIDNQGPIIDIVIPGEGCTTVSSSPVIRVETDETANCTFNKNIPADLENYHFDYSGSRYHESRTSVPGNGGYEFTVSCIDLIGNPSEKNVSFTVNDGAGISINSLSLASTYYTGLSSDLLVRLSGNIGGVSDSQFSFSINGTNLTNEEFAITNIGCGSYTLSFTAPSKAADYPIAVNAAGDEDTDTISVVNLNINISYDNLSSATVLNKIVYGKSGSTVTGIATESYASDPSSQGTAINLVSNSLDSSTYIFAAPSTSYIRSIDKMLGEKKFEESINPNFGSEPKKVKYTTAMKLAYGYAYLYSESLGGIELLPGRYNVVIKNNGLDNVTGKDEIELVVTG